MAARFSGSPGQLRLAAIAAVPAYAIAAIVVPRAGIPLTTYAAASATARAADIAAGLGLLAAGLIAAAEPRGRRLGVLTVLAGIVWFGPDWEGWNNGPALARSLGALAPPLFLALVFHLALSSPTGRLRSRLERGTVAAVYTLAAVASISRALFRDPFLDPYCWRNCIDNSFLVRSDAELTRTVDALWLRSSLALAVVLVAAAAWRLLAASAPGRRLVWPTVAASALVGAAASAYAGALWHDPLEDPQSNRFASLFLALSFAAVAFAAVVGRNALRVRRTLASVTLLARELRDAPQPGGLQAALAAVLSDPTLTVAYWLPDSRRFVDAAGRDAEPPTSSDGRAVTPIMRGGDTIALVGHDASLLDVPDLGREIGSAARLAVENERLQAEVLAQLEALRASRARIVETADDERRRLERNLHDGAQQRLLALSYQLRLTRADAEADGDAELATLLTSSVEQAQATLDELRTLAQGIYPAILTEAGLGAALATLAETAPVPLELTGIPTGRYPAPVEAAAYVSVAEAIDDAAARGATFVSVESREDEGRLVIVARDDGEGRISPPIQVSDRVGALGGSVDAGPTSLRAEIPCA